MSDEKPTKMTVGDAARIDRAQLHIRRLQEEIRAYQAEVAEVAAAYQLDQQDRVDLRTGEITRPSPSPSPAPAVRR